jgi:hypothetical protein
VPEITQITVTNKVSPNEVHYALVFVDKNKNYMGYLLDLIINQWRQEKISNDLNDYELDLRIPQGWYQIAENKLERADFVSIKARIIAHVIELEGELEEFSIIDAKSKTTKKYRLNSKFEIPLNRRQRFSVTKIFSEAQLKEITNSETKLRIINKIRLPRVFYNNLYHPPSKRVWDTLKLLTQGLSNSERGNFASSVNFEQVEGNNLIAPAYEKPLLPFPVLVEDNQENIIDVRLLVKDKEYKKVLSFKPQFEANPTPEFAELLEIANKEIGKQILGLK